MVYSYVYKEHQRSLRYLKDAILVGKYDFPLLKPSFAIPRNVHSFHERKSVCYPAISWLDYFIDDSYFIIMKKLDDFEWLKNLETLNTIPEIREALSFLKLELCHSIYVRLDLIAKSLRSFEGVISPDFSVYPEMPEIERIYVSRQSRIIAYRMQKLGINIVPSISWAFIEDFDWCLDGILPNSSVAISTNGCKREEYSRRIFLEGVEEIQNRLNPLYLIICGGGFDELKKYDNIVYYPSFSQRLRLRLEEKKLKELLLKKHFGQLELPFMQEAKHVFNWSSHTGVKCMSNLERGGDEWAGEALFSKTVDL